MPSLPDRRASEASDEALAALAREGDGDALEALLRRHQGWIYNLALRMLQAREDAQDATQEVLVKIATRLSAFRGESAFRTWVWRIAANHVLDCARSRPEQTVHSFECYGDYLESASDEDLPPGIGSPQERDLLVTEAKQACTLGVLLCLDREQRLVFVLGEMFEVGDAVGAEVTGLTRANYRQRLARAREQLYGFMAGRCGLADPRNPCRCARKTAAFIRDGIVDPQRLVFAAPAVARVREALPDRVRCLEHLAYTGARTLYREQPLQDAPDAAGRLRRLMASPSWRTALDLPPSPGEDA
jgi:RNA polymerase sigma factor (sigma-70 family)